MKPSVPSESNSPENEDRDILIAGLVITYQARWCDVLLTLYNSVFAIRSLHLAHAFRNSQRAQH